MRSINENQSGNDTSEDHEDLNEDDEVTIEDYSCFQLKKNEEADEEVACRSKSKSSNKPSNDHSTVSSSSISVSTSSSSLPPLPRQQQSGIATPSISQTTDFDRSLHCRRSNRYLRQTTPNSLVIQEININASSSPSASLSSNLNAIKENATTSSFSSSSSATVSKVLSSLVAITKAISTPSLVQTTDNNSVQGPASSSCQQSDDVITESAKVSVEDNSRCTKSSKNGEVVMVAVERKHFGKNGNFCSLLETFHFRGYM